MQCLKLVLNKIHKKPHNFNIAETFFIDLYRTFLKLDLITSSRN